MITDSIGEYIWKRLRQVGVRHVFGVPGDFNLSFLEQIDKVEGIEFVGTCNELNAAYAADGYARLNGVGALVTTFGVGELSALNGVAGASAEHVPIICLNGAPPLHAIESRMLLHHSLADGNFQTSLNVFQQFTAAQACIHPANAAEEIDRCLRVCLREKRPVYLQLPSDITYLKTLELPEIHPDEALAVGASEPQQLEYAFRSISNLIRGARRPAILVDQEAERFRLAGPLENLSRSVGIPFAALSTGKCVMDERGPLWLGVYAGQMTKSQAVRERIETSDCLIVTAPRFIETNSGGFTQSLPADTTVTLTGPSVTVGTKEVYYNVSLKELLNRLASALSRESENLDFDPISVDQSLTSIETLDFKPGEVLTHYRLWPLLRSHLIKPHDVVIAEAGTSSIGLGPEPMPEGVTYISSGIWGSIGFTLPAVLGTSLASPSRRSLLFIGDGSFQMTAQEFSTILRECKNPVIVVINNKGYTIERYILGWKSKYNEVTNWKFAQLPQVFSDHPEKVLTASIKTEDELADTLAKVADWQGPVLLELQLDAYDAPEGLKKFGPQVATFDYGPFLMSS